MSGRILAVWHTGESADAPDTRRLAAAMSHGHPVSELHIDAISLAWTGAALCGSSGSGLVHAVMDGRIDNRSELARALGCDAARRSDADLVASAYDKWGSDFASRLLGDFAVVIADRLRRQLVCARDVIGIKPLYYRIDRGRIVCASELPAFLAAGATGPNEGVLGEYLACAVSSPEETLYTGVKRLRPAHLLVADQHGHRLRRFWDPRDVAEVRHRRDGDYAAHLRTILFDAVRCRTRGARRVGVLLSGGLDSSSIAAVAATLRTSGNDGVSAVSAVFPGRRCDESQYVDAIVRATGLASATVAPGPVAPDTVDLDAKYFADFPGYPNTTTTSAARALARERGIDVLLTGEGGDEWLAGSYYRYADFVRRGHVVGLARAFRSDRAVAGADCVEFPPRRLLTLGIWPNVPLPVKTAYRRIRARRRGSRVPEWIDPAFARHIELAARLEFGFTRERGESFSRAHIRSSIGRAADVHYLEIMERSSARLGLDERHPFHDRRIVEFALGVPDEQRWGSLPKDVLRRAVDGLVPDIVRMRTTKAYFPHSYAEALLAAGGERIADTLHPWLAERLVVPRVRTMLDAVVRGYATGDERYTDHIWACWMIYGLDRWLRTVVDPTSRAEEPAHA